MSLGFPVKVDWGGPDDSAEVVYDPPPEVVILSAEVCREYYEEKNIYVILDWLEDKYGWCINGVELLNEGTLKRDSMLPFFTLVLETGKPRVGRW